MFQAAPPAGSAGGDRRKANMKRRLTMSAVALAAGACLVLAVSAEASERSRFEIFLRGAHAPASSGTAYFHEYDPNPGYKIAGSYLRQTLSIDPLAGWGAQVGATVFFGGAWGVRFSLGREEHALAGAPSSYEMKFLHTYFLPWLDPSRGGRRLRAWHGLARCVGPPRPDHGGAGSRRPHRSRPGPEPGPLRRAPAVFLGRQPAVPGLYRARLFALRRAHLPRQLRPAQPAEPGSAGNDRGSGSQDSYPGRDGPPSQRDHPERAV